MNGIIILPSISQFIFIAVNSVAFAHLDFIFNVIIDPKAKTYEPGKLIAP